jgi:hypothetical protein
MEDILDRLPASLHWTGAGMQTTSIAQVSGTAWLDRPLGDQGK